VRILPPEEEGVAQAACDNLPATPIPQSLRCSGGGGRESGVKLSLGRREGKMCITPEGKCKEDGNKLLSVVPSGTGHKLKHRTFHLNIRKHFFTDGDLTLAQVVQKGHLVFLLADTQKLLEYGAEHPTLGGSA